MATTSQNKKNEMESQGSSVMEQAKGAAETVKEKARQTGEYVRDKADQAVSSTGKGMESLASTVRDKGPKEGILGQATAGVADTLDRTGQYLEEHGVSGMVDDLTTMIKNHPLPAILIGIGIGFMLARLTTTTRS